MSQNIVASGETLGGPNVSYRLLSLAKTLGLWLVSHPRDHRSQIPLHSQPAANFTYRVILFLIGINS